MRRDTGRFILGAIVGGVFSLGAGAVFLAMLPTSVDKERAFGLLFASVAISSFVAGRRAQRSR